MTKFLMGTMFGVMLVSVIFSCCEKQTTIYQNGYRQGVHDTGLSGYEMKIDTTWVKKEK